MASVCMPNVVNSQFECDSSYYSRCVLEEMYMTKLHINPLSFHKLEITSHLEPLVKSHHGIGTKESITNMFINCWEENDKFDTWNGPSANYKEKSLTPDSLGITDIHDDINPWYFDQKYPQSGRCRTLKVYQHQVISNDDKWEIQFAISGIRQNNPKSSIVVEIQILFDDTVYQHCLTVSSNMSSILQYTIENLAKEQWQINDIPLDIWDIIQEYVPIYFWTHGEPSLMIDDIGQQLDDNKLPHDLLCTDWIWREGFFIETTCPKRVIPCAIKCETCDDFDGVFIPTEIRPRPTASCMIWIDDDTSSSNSKDNNKTDVSQDEGECVPYIARSYESSHWYNENGLYAYPYGISSPSYNPYNNNGDPMTYAQQMSQLPTLNPCGYLSDSDTTVRDDIVPSPVSLALLNGATPLTSQPQANARENKLHKEEGYDQGNEWEHEYLNMNDMCTRTMPLEYLQAYSNSSPIISPGFTTIGHDTINPIANHSCSCQNYLNMGYCYCHWPQVMTESNVLLYWPYINSSATMYPTTAHDTSQESREQHWPSISCPRNIPTNTYGCRQGHLHTKNIQKPHK